MKYLFLDLASHDACMACVDQRVLSYEQVANRLSDDELIPLLDRTLKGANWILPDLTHIACVIGPGGFTSLRTAVTFANVLGDQLGIPSAGLHLSDVYAARAENGKRKVQSGKSKEENIFWVHSTKKDQLFIRGGQWNEPTLITLDEIQNSKFKIQHWSGELIDEHKEVIGGTEVQLVPLQDVLPDLVSQAEYSSKILHPWYGRGW